MGDFRSARAKPIAPSAPTPTGRRHGEPVSVSRRVAAVLVAVVLAAAGCSDDTAAPSEHGPGRCGGDARLVVSYADPDQDGAVTVAVADTVTGERRDVRSEWTASQPSVHPDGQRLALNRADGDYESAGPDSEQIWAVDLDGSDPQQLTEGPRDTQPAWSPDGNRVAYVAGNHLAVVDVDGGDPEVLVEVERWTQVASPVWSPDEHSVAYIMAPSIDPPAPPSVQVVDVESGATRELLRGEGEQFMALTWLRDPELIALGRFDPIRAATDLVAVPPDGGDATVIHHEAGALRQSARGELYAFIPALVRRPSSFHPASLAGTRLTLGDALPVEWRGADGLFDVTTCRP